MRSSASINGLIISTFAAATCITTSDAFTTKVIHSTNNESNIRINTRLDLEPTIIAGGALATAGAIAFWTSNSQNRENQARYAEYEANQLEKQRLAYIEPRGPDNPWTEEELAQYDGTADDETGPLLLAVKGDVFNVGWKGRGFYGPGAEYHIMAGRDATRFLAKNRLEEETEDERKVALNIAERANLEAWYWQIKNKYDIVGTLEGYDPKSTEM